MAEKPSEYRWSSYGYNAMGESNQLVTPHLEYRRLGAKAIERQAAYRQLFQEPISETTLDQIREATNKAWALGSDRFKQRVQKQDSSLTP